jgi:ABC transporter ATM
MARQSQTPETKGTPPKVETKEPSKKEQRRSDWVIIKRLMSNVWPKNDWRTRGTVLFGFVLLVSAKVCPARTIGSRGDVYGL